MPCIDVRSFTMHTYYINKESVVESIKESGNVEMEYVIKKV